MTSSERSAMPGQSEIDQEVKLLLSILSPLPFLGLLELHFSPDDRSHS